MRRSWTDEVYDVTPGWEARVRKAAGELDPSQLSSLERESWDTYNASGCPGEARGVILHGLLSRRFCESAPGRAAKLDAWKERTDGTD